MESDGGRKRTLAKIEGVGALRLGKSGRYSERASDSKRWRVRRKEKRGQRQTRRLVRDDIQILNP